MVKIIGRVDKIYLIAVMFKATVPRNYSIVINATSLSIIAHVFSKLWYNRLHFIVNDFRELFSVNKI